MKPLAISCIAPDIVDNITSNGFALETILSSTLPNVTKLLETSGIDWSSLYNQSPIFAKISSNPLPASTVIPSRLRKPIPTALRSLRNISNTDVKPLNIL